MRLTAPSAGDFDELRRRLAREGAVTLAIRVRPNAPRTAWKATLADGSLKVDVAAPPEEGRANAALAAWIADAVGVPHANVRIVAGAGARRKLVRVGR